MKIIKKNLINNTYKIMTEYSNKPFEVCGLALISGEIFIHKLLAEYEKV